MQLGDRIRMDALADTRISRVGALRIAEARAPSRADLPRIEQLGLYPPAHLEISSGDSLFQNLLDRKTSGAESAERRFERIVPSWEKPIPLWKANYV